MSRLTQFYDRYHQKNDRYRKLIRPNNFTYFYILQLLIKAGLGDLRQKKVLDVGCGVGTMSLYAASLGATVMGVDISERAIAIAKAAKQSLGFPKVTFKVSELQLGKSTYDVVFCFEVIEHIKNDQAFIRLLHSQLKNNGVLVLSTPSSENMLYQRGFYQQFDTEVGHLRRYTPEKLCRLLTKAGFEIETLRTVEGPLRNILFTTQLGLLIRFIRGPLVPLFHFFDRSSGQLMGYTDIQVVAVKK